MESIKLKRIAAADIEFDSFHIGIDNINHFITTVFPQWLSELRNSEIIDIKGVIQMIDNNIVLTTSNSASLHSDLFLSKQIYSLVTLKTDSSKGLLFFFGKDEECIDHSQSSDIIRKYIIGIVDYLKNEFSQATLFLQKENLKKEIILKNGIQNPQTDYIINKLTMPIIKQPQIIRDTEYEDEILASEQLKTSIIFVPSKGQLFGGNFHHDFRNNVDRIVDNIQTQENNLPVYILGQTSLVSMDGAIREVVVRNDDNYFRFHPEFDRSQKQLIKLKGLLTFLVYLAETHTDIHYVVTSILTPSINKRYKILDAIFEIEQMLRKIIEQ